MDTAALLLRDMANVLKTKDPAAVTAWFEKHAGQVPFTPIVPYATRIREVDVHVDGDTLEASIVYEDHDGVYKSNIVCRAARAPRGRDRIFCWSR